MKIKEKLKELLINHGIFDTWADDILKIEQDSNQAMTGRWDDLVEDYPDVLINVLWVSTKYTAKKYVIEKCPSAWFLPALE
jgi:hypothetical protein